MTTCMRSRWIPGLVVAFALLGLAAEEVAAVIGRPLTPMSYAGVARRTARRTTYAAAATGAYAGAGAGYVTAVPSGCTTVVTSGVSYRDCGGTMYRPYYNGTTVVYRVQ